MDFSQGLNLDCGCAVGLLWSTVMSLVKLQSPIRIMNGSRQMREHDCHSRGSVLQTCSWQQSGICAYLERGCTIFTRSGPICTLYRLCRYVRTQNGNMERENVLVEEEWGVREQVFSSTAVLLEFGRDTKSIFSSDLHLRIYALSFAHPTFPPKPYA
jgi:hypothetical protein